MEIMTGLPLIFFFIALFYAMVGFGGGSSYLAVLVLLGFSYREVPAIALMCNLIVTLGGCWHFYRAGHLKPKIVLPFVLLSIPMAYFGGRIMIGKELFCILLGLSLLAVAVRLVLPGGSFDTIREVTWRKAMSLGAPLGALLGFLAGLVGIGGGIFLSPVLLLLKWASVKQAAAAASFFIVVNSMAGLAGHLQKGVTDLSMFFPLALAVFFGGQLGSRLGATKVPKFRMQQLLAVLVFCVSVKLLMEAA